MYLQYNSIDSIELKYNIYLQLNLSRKYLSLEGSFKFPAEGYLFERRENGQDQFLFLSPMPI